MTGPAIKGRMIVTKSRGPARIPNHAISHSRGLLAGLFPGLFPGLSFEPLAKVKLLDSGMLVGEMFIPKKDYTEVSTMKF